MRSGIRALAVLLFFLATLTIFSGRPRAGSMLAARVAALEAFLGIGPTTLQLDDDFEDDLDPQWVQVSGSTVTIAPTTGCAGAYAYHNCGSLGLHFDESEQFDFPLPERSAGSFSLFFYDDPSNRDADVIIGGVLAGTEWIGVQTDVCQDHYVVGLGGNVDKICTPLRRRLGWHHLALVRDGRSSRGYLDHILVFETISPGNRNEFDLFRIYQNAPSPSKMLDGFAIDDVQFVAFD